MKEFKSDLVLLFEYGSGWKLDDYLFDRVNKGWMVAKIVKEMNEFIDKVDFKKARKKKMFVVKESNVARWYVRHGIVSQVKKGGKLEHIKKGVE